MRFLEVFLGLSALAALAAAAGGEAPCRCGSGGRSGADTIDLGSLEWRFREAGTGDWLPAAVPGCVHTDLLRNGLIEEPFYRDNETRIQWIGERDWEYRAELPVTEELLGRDRVELDFEGLDTYARVYLNDSLLLSADNMFRRWRVDCAGALRRGSNELRIVFASAARMNEEKAAASPREPIERYVFTRKAAYHFGWDWGPVCVTAGIWRRASLRAWDDARIEDLALVQEKVTPARARLTARFEVCSERSQTAVLSLSWEEERVGDRRRDGSRHCGRAERRVRLAAGTNVVNLPVVIEKPRLWWSRGLGDQALYEFSGALSIRGKVADRAIRRTGLRTVRVVREPDSAGSSFAVELNGVRVFMKGANCIPLDLFLASVPPERYERLVRDAAAANMNMLRVWGGGVYESDLFYDLCDRWGLLVWQDFMFACAMYPGDSAFVENVRGEAIDAVTRLRNHPSIALWCGNNEILNGWRDWGWPGRYSPEDSAAAWRDYERIFHELLPGIVREYDPGKFYWPSSPLLGWGRPFTREGDAHYWGVWHGREPFEVFEERGRIGRFMSEYGFQGMPPLESIREFTTPEDREIGSEVMRIHQKHRTGFPIIDEYMGWYYRRPRDFESYVYVSQLLQARGIGMAIEAHRRAMPFCMGTLYWQLNDCYPVTSWSGIDCYGRWKALHYAARRLYAETIVSPAVEKDTLAVHVVSDGRAARRARLACRLLDFAGAVLWERAEDIELPANSGAVCMREALATLLAGRDPSAVLLDAALSTDGTTLARSRYYFVPPKDLRLAKPRISCRVSPAAGGWRLELSTDALAKNVYLRLEGAEGFFSDNFFDLVPGEDTVVECTAGAAIPDFGSRLRITSLVDSYSW